MRSKAILAHLNEVIRYYRMAVTPIQKTGEPSDMLYAEQAQAGATQAAQLAFQSARDEAALLARIEGQPGSSSADAQQGETQKLTAAQAAATKQINDLLNRRDALKQQIENAPSANRAALQEHEEDVEGQLELAQATSEALAKVSGISNSQTNSGLQGDIDSLQHAAPELIDGKVKPVANTIEPIGSLHDSGVTTQAMVLFQLLGAARAIDQRITETQKLHDQALELRTPLVNILRATLEAGRKLQTQPNPDSSVAPGSGSANPPSSVDLKARKKTYDELSDAFRTISAVSTPISQEVLLLEQARGNLLSWRAAVDAERSTIVHSLLIRVLAIAIALFLILALSEVWRRAATRYVQDVRRRRQLLLIRRIVIGFLIGIVLLLGFVSQFSSLATFAGFITAGIAVGLQTILLSVAAYFFIVGRYGVRVGDRITVAGVTGDVVEVGLVRFYMMELTGTGTELHQTGRVAVFANSVLFQTGTPIYKQIPGTNYAWHELTLKLKPGSDYRVATEPVRTAIEKVYDTYKGQIEQQHKTVESWMDTALDAPKIEARLQLSDGLQYAVLYPVEIDDASEIDEQIVQQVLDVVTLNTTISSIVDGPPTVRAVVKG
ncbi:MAG: mechanosensitive ion channel family protein [Acidobacteriaceae bacterium]|nr:mechanosensitive ion channel family protein [Acidobacteriaceae bacterium]